MVKNHIKRLTVPKTWKTDRKSTKYITRPNSGAHSLELGISLNLLFKDVLRYCKTTKEVKAILNDKEVLVDGKRRYDEKFMVGFMDVVSIPSINEHYRVLLNKKGKLIAISISKKEAELKISKISGKTILGKNKMQLNFTDGKNILVKDSKYNVGDSLLLTLPKQEIKEHFKLDKKSFVIFTGGNNIGSLGEVEEIKGNTITIKIDKKQVQSSKKFAFIVGEKKPALNLSVENEQDEGNKGSKSNA
jgi:small subunit ribosomal protein S4e